MLTELDALASHAVQMGGSEKGDVAVLFGGPLVLVEHPDIAPAKIIAEDEEDVGFLGLFLTRKGQEGSGQRQNGENQGLHGNEEL